MVQDLAEGVDETVDIPSFVKFSDAIERALAEGGKVHGKIVAAEDAALAQRSVDRCHAAASRGKIDDEFLEEATRKRHGDARKAGKPPCRVMGLRRDELAYVLETLRAHERQVDGVRNRPQINGVAGPVLAVFARAV